MLRAAALALRRPRLQKTNQESWWKPFLLTEASEKAYISCNPKFLEGESMDSKKASRRKFLKGGAAAAAASAIQAATGHAEVPGAAKRSLKDEVAYGERSPYINSVRIAVKARPSPDEFGLTFHVLTPLQDSVGQ